jgi:WD40 repeat protein
MAMNTVALNVTWSGCGHYIAVGTKADQLLVVDVRKAGKDIGGATIASRDIGAELNELAWHPETGHLYAATGSYLGTGLVQVHDIKQAPLTSMHNIMAHTNTTTCLKITDTYIVTGSADAIVGVFTAGELACARTLTNMNTPIRHVSVSSDSKMVLYAAEDGHCDLVYAATGEHIYSWKIGQASACAFSTKLHSLAFAIDDTNAKGERYGAVLRHTAWPRAFCRPVAA